jgi:tagatose 6-phosphate kinase
MLLCVNPNAAIDKTLVVENYRLGAIHRPSQELDLPGGKGCNVARAAKTMGRQPVVAGWVGGHAGRYIEEGLNAEGILTAFVHTAVESRTCVSVVDPLHGTLTEVYEKGRPVSAGELSAFYTVYQEWLPRVKMVTLSGSLPPGVPPDFYAEAARLAGEAGVPVILDSSGEPLRRGLEAGGPTMLKCNRTELSGLAGEPLDSLEELRRVAVELNRRWKAQVVVTLGEGGSVAVDDQETWLARAPRIEAVSAVGSGDAFLAGLASALLSAQPLVEALRLAVAAGSANALQLGAGRLRLEDVHRLLEQVDVAAWAAA